MLSECAIIICLFCNSELILWKNAVHLWNMTVIVAQEKNIYPALGVSGEKALREYSPESVIYVASHYTLKGFVEGQEDSQIVEH